MQAERITKAKPPLEFKKFETMEEGEVLFLATTNGGHTAAVTDHAEPLHPIFHRAAMAEGAIPEGQREAFLARKEMDEVSVEKTRPDIIIEACEKVQKLADENPERVAEYILGDGRPDVKAVEAIAGIGKISAAERDKAWATLQEEG
jgi:hypothetical protein